MRTTLLPLCGVLDQDIEKADVLAFAARKRERNRTGQ